MSAPADMTVIEFAAKHCADCGPGDDMRANIQDHVNMLAEAAISTDHVLWTVVIDADGRASLLWSTMPETLWESLLEIAIKLQAVKRMLGMS